MQALFEQATPFADALAAAARTRRWRTRRSSATVQPPQHLPEPEPDQFFEAPTGLYGPQPNVSAIREAAPAPAPEPKPTRSAAAADTPTVTRLIAARSTAYRRRSEPGGRRRRRRGCCARAAVDPRNRSYTGAALAALLHSVTTALGLVLIIAVIGGGGAGISTAIVHLASRDAAAGADVAVIALRGDGDLAHRLSRWCVGVIAAMNAVQARDERLQRQPLVNPYDTPATGPSHGARHQGAAAT